MEHKLYFKNSKGDKLSAVLSISNKDKTTSIIIICHGFASHKNGSAKKISSELNARGINTMRFDFYGHGESDGKFEDITISEGVNDILQVIKYLKNNGYTKIGLLGTSFGGACSIIAAGQTNDLFLLALRSPVADYFTRELMTKTKEYLVDWKLNGDCIYRKGEDKELRLKYSFYEDMKNLNGLLSATKIIISTFIVHGDKDEIIPIILSEMLNKAIINSELKVIQGADHRYTDPKLDSIAVDLLIEFISSKSNTLQKTINCCL